MTGGLKAVRQKKSSLSSEISEIQTLLDLIEWKLREFASPAQDEQGQELTSENITRAVDKITETIIHDDVERKVILFPMDGALHYASAMLASFEKKVADIPWLTVKATSYDGMTCGDIRVELPSGFNFIDAVVYVADDVMDTGKTSIKIRELLRDAGAKEVKFVPLVDKFKAERKIQAWCAGFKISPEDFIIGFGFGYRKNCRNFKNIVVVTPDLLPSEEEDKCLSKLPELKEKWLSLHREGEPHAAATEIQRIFRGRKARCGFFDRKVKATEADSHTLSGSIADTFVL